MAKLKAILGYTVAALMIPLALATLMGLNDWMRLLVSTTGLTVSPWFTGGEVIQTVDHGDYQTRIHRPVFDALIGERSEGFVQVDWTPPTAVPARIDEQVDFDGDGQVDFHIELDTQTRQANLTPLTSQVLGLEGVYRLDDAWAIRVTLKNSR
jgi:hypothetical protein